jgi:hypothetical protein
MMTDALGPRGGKVRIDVQCSTCIAYLDPCTPGACNLRWGCSDWVDINGNRAIIPMIEAEPDIAGQIELF